VTAASNTRDCFREFIGQRLIGLLFGALPLNRNDLSSGTTTMVFADGRGLTLGGNGSYWIDSADDVQRAVNRSRAALEQTQADIREVLATAGALMAEGAPAGVGAGAGG
jgi:hypothetical protein